MSNCLSYYKGIVFSIFVTTNLNVFLIITRQHCSGKVIAKSLHARSNIVKCTYCQCQIIVSIYIETYNLSHILYLLENIINAYETKKIFQNM